jgi:hypothetical protein
MKSVVFKLIKNIMRKRTSEIEDYINSKNPQSVHDVEYWTKEYDNKIIYRGTFK